jgi:hypothetical protein
MERGIKEDMGFSSMEASGEAFPLGGKEQKHG